MKPATFIIIKAQNITGINNWSYSNLQKMRKKESKIYQLAASTRHKTILKTCCFDLDEEMLCSALKLSPFRNIIKSKVAAIVNSFQIHLMRLFYCLCQFTKILNPFAFSLLCLLKAYITVRQSITGQNTAKISLNNSLSYQRLTQIKLKLTFQMNS